MTGNILCVDSLHEGNVVSLVVYNILVHIKVQIYTWGESPVASIVFIFKDISTLQPDLSGDQKMHHSDQPVRARNI